MFLPGPRLTWCFCLLCCFTPFFESAIEAGEQDKPLFCDMNEAFLFKLKLFFLLFVSITMLMLFAGIVLISQSFLLSNGHVEMLVSYARYELEALMHREETLFAAVSSLFRLDNPLAAKEQETGKKAAAVPVLLYHGIVKKADLVIDDDGEHH